MATTTPRPGAQPPPKSAQTATLPGTETPLTPGEYFLCDEPVELNHGRRTVTLTVRNTGDRAIQIGSHFHFFEVNRALDFDRNQAIGMRLNIPSGTTVRIEPGDTRDVTLVAIGGTRRAVGFNALVMGSVTGKWSVKQAIDRAAELDFRGVTSNGQKEGQK